MRSSIKDKFIDGTLVLFITLFSLSVFYPFYYVIINSINGDLFYGPVFLIPTNLSLKSYEIIFATSRMIDAFMISVLRTVAGTVFSVFILTSAAFALRKRNLVFRKFYLALFTVPIFFDGGLIPYFLNLRSLGLYNTFWVYIFPTAFSFFSLVILMTSFNDLSSSIEESAYIDGASPMRILLRIFLPLCIPVIATISLFRAVTMWNSWFDTLFFTINPKLMTLSGVLFQIVVRGEASNELNQSDIITAEMFSAIEGLKLATVIVAITPILATYPFVQRYFIKGIRLGSVKE